MEARIREMFGELASAPREMLPSKYWEELNRKNLAQLADEGYENFKRTLATNYFTWVVRPSDAQLRFLRQHLSRWAVTKAAIRTIFAGRHRPMGWLRSKSYTYLTRLVWEYALAHDPDRLLGKLEEPLEGNPPRLYREGRLISQDLANSVLEYRSILAPEVDRTQVRTILELGPGYGRTAFVFLSLMPGVRYVLADIPPALAVSERYLSKLFAGKRIFRYRPFQRYESVKEEFERSELAFLLPHQLELLPEKSVDLFINISSLHEMRIDQIRYYFGVLRRLVRRYFYLKQWRESVIPFENVTIREGDYPVPAEWTRIYWRPCAIQEYFFEALFEMP
ncbi:MAG TPA: putative sugar O-methyltransferase [Planctomycetota bacterium]|nr:putative sugar O-methyltransferase [Planctomycetota bacterium]